MITKPISSTSTGTPIRTTRPSVDRRREQDDRDDEVGDDRAGEPRGDVEGAAGAHRVVRDRRDDLARRVLLLDRGPGPRGVVRDDLRHAERGLEPVRDREAVAHHARRGLGRAEPEQDQRPLGERAVVVVDDPVLDGAADRRRHQRLRDHPDHAEEDACEQASRPGGAPTQSRKRTGDRVSGVRDR